MVVRRSATDKDQMLAFLSMQSGARPATRLAGVDGFGIAWALVVQIAGWVIQGIGLGLSVNEAIRSAKAEKDRQMPGQTLTSGDVDDMAAQISLIDPNNRSTDFWRRALAEGDFGPTPPECPAGSLWNAATNRCELIKGAGLFSAMPTWGWLLLGVGGFYVLTQTGIVKLARR